MNDATDAAIMRASHQIAALQHRVAEMSAEIEALDDLRNRMADILQRTAVALRGPEPDRRHWGWHDLPERTAAAMASIAVMQEAARISAAEAERLRLLIERVCARYPDDDVAPTCVVELRRGINASRKATETAQPTQPERT